MTDIIERLRYDAARCEAQFSKGVAGNIEEAAAEIVALRDLVQTLLDNDPSEPIADNGMTVLDGWRHRARQLLEGVGK